MDKVSSLNFLINYLSNKDISLEFNGRTLRFPFTNADKVNFETSFNLLGIDFSPHINSEFEIQIHKTFNNGSSIIFYDEKDFLNRGYDSFESFENNHLIIINPESKLIQKYANQTYNDSSSIIFNFYNYRKILHFLENSEQFVSIQSKAELQFVIFSSEKGPFHLGYNLHESRLKDLEDLGKVYKGWFQKLIKHTIKVA